MPMMPTYGWTKDEFGRSTKNTNAEGSVRQSVPNGWTKDEFGRSTKNTNAEASVRQSACSHCSGISLDCISELVVMSDMCIHMTGDTTGWK